MTPIEVFMDAEDFNSLPPFGEFKFDKDGYPLYYFYNNELRKVTSFRVHRWVLREPKGYLVDHINGNKCDARKSNLRIVTHQQNQWNMRKPRVNSRGEIPYSPYKGVTFYKNLQKWKTTIYKDSKPQYLGIFDSQEDAAKAYNEAAKRLYGEYALLNLVS